MTPSRKRTPASVRVAPARERSNSRADSHVSSLPIWRLTADSEVRSSRAAQGEAAVPRGALEGDQCVRGRDAVRVAMIHDIKPSYHAILRCICHGWPSGIETESPSVSPPMRKDDNGRTGAASRGKITRLSSKRAGTVPRNAREGRGSGRLHTETGAGQEAR